MAIKVKHNDPTLNSFSKNDIVINIKEGSLFYKSNTNLFRIKGDNMKTATTESFGDELWARSGNNLFYTSGSVGIGTATPSDKLTITDGSVLIQSANYVQLQVDQTDSGKASLGVTSGTSETFISSETNNASFDADIKFLTNDGSGNSEIVRFKEDGKVGIGTTTPSEKLELGAGGKIKLTSNSSVSGSIVVLAGDSEAILSTENDSATGDPLQFVLKHNFGSTELINRRGDLILSASGHIVSPTSRVGIGTASPSYHLHVENADDTQALFKSTDAGPTYVRIDTSAADGDTNSGVIYQENGSNKVFSGYSATNDTAAFVYATGGNSTKGININSDGLVGINTSTPTAGDDSSNYPTKLTVTGMISSSKGFNVASHIASGDLSVGYYTIATCFRGRAVGRFIIEDRDSSRHMGTVFYASTFFGDTNSSNKKHHINVISAGQYSTQTVTKIRIKAGGTYDGKVLQIYVANATNALRVRFLGDAAQTHGWKLKDFIPDATPPPAGTLSYNGHNNVSGSSTYANITAANGVEFDLGTDGNTTGTTGDFQINGDLNVDGTITKGAGSFRIDHPDPIKTDTHYLYHNFVESPTEGDNIYRWTITTTNNTHTIDLPDYYKFLNKNDMVWVNAVDHFGRAYGTINNEQTKLTITSDTDGKYNVLLIGTRKDQFIKDNYKGVEVKK